MSWIKLDDALPSNRKIKDLSDRAFRLYVYGLCYCGRDLTDGIIDKDDELGYCRPTSLFPEAWQARLKAEGAPAR